MIAMFLFAVGLLIVPFNDIPHFTIIFGEMGLEASFFPFLFLVIFFYFRMNFSFYLPRSKSFYFILSFLIIVIISGIINIPSILQAQFMERTGISKFFFQFIILLFGIALSLTIFNLFLFGLIDLKKVRNFLTIGFIICGFYSIVEIFYLIGFSWAEVFLESINLLIHSEESGILLYEGRLRSVTGEPSYFGMYGALVFPWLISYLFTEKHRLPFLLLIIYLVLMMLLSLSRLAYGLLLIETFLIVYFIFRSKLFSLRTIGIVLIITSASIIICLYLIVKMPKADVELLRQGVLLSLSSEENLSNICRYGTQVAAIHMGLDHPILGTGLGQFPFYMEKYLPAWSMISPEIRGYLHGEGLPRVHGMYTRIFSEVGFLGLISWVGFFLYLFRDSYRIVLSSLSTNPDWLGIALLINLLAIGFFGFSIATFRKLEMWVIFGLSWAYVLNYSYILKYIKNNK